MDGLDRQTDRQMNRLKPIYPPDFVTAFYIYDQQCNIFTIGPEVLEKKM